MEKIPVEIKKQIEDEAEKQYPLLAVNDGAYINNKKNKAKFKHGAEFGYSLASKVAPDQRVRELEEGLTKILGWGNVATNEPQKNFIKKLLNNE